MLAPVVDLHSHQSLHWRVIFRKYNRHGVAGDVPESQRSLNLAHITKESKTLWLTLDQLSNFGRNAAGEDLLYYPVGLVSEKQPIPGAGQ